MNEGLLQGLIIIVKIGNAAYVDANPEATLGQFIAHLKRALHEVQAGELGDAAQFELDEYGEGCQPIELVDSLVSNIESAEELAAVVGKERKLSDL